MTERQRVITALDLFAGAGGSTLGAIAAGARVIAAVDNWSLAHNTYVSNFPSVMFLHQRCEDVSIRSLKAEIGSIDLLIASPECTSHTCAKGKARRSEASRQTAFQVIRFAKALKPRWVAVENVIHMRSWRFYKRWLRELEGLGYQVREQVINAADHGVPQSRRRLFVMCDRERTPPRVAARAGRKKTAAGILERNGAFKFSLLRRKGRAAATLERADRAVEAVGTNQPFLLVYYGSDSSGGWQRLGVPLRTQTTLDRFAYVRPSAHGHRMRMLQVPEIKAAMGFPSAYRMEYGNRRGKIKLLGNAVCPPVMTAVLQALME